MPSSHVYLFCFADEPPLEGVDFLYHLVRAGVTPFQLPPAMDVHGVFQLLLQRLAPGPLLQQLSLDVVQLSPAVHRQHTASSLPFW